MKKNSNNLDNNVFFIWKDGHLEEASFINIEAVSLEVMASDSTSETGLRRFPIAMGLAGDDLFFVFGKEDYDVYFQIEDDEFIRNQSLNIKFGDLKNKEKIINEIILQNPFLFIEDNEERWKGSVVLSKNKEEMVTSVTRVPSGFF